MRFAISALWGVILWGSAAQAQIIEVQLKEEMPAEQGTPLAGIRGWEIPEKRPVRLMAEGQRPAEPTEELMLEEIGDRLMFAPSGKERAMPGFAVRGHGVDALREVHRVMALGGSKTVDFRPSEPMSIVFFTHSFDRRVRITKVVQQGSTLQLTYRFLPAPSRRMNAYLALIPLTQGEAGAPQRVEFVPAEDARHEVPDLTRWMEKIISRSFVVGDPKRRSSARDEQYRGRWHTPRRDLLRS